MIADPETVLFLLVLLGLCVGVMWQMHESHKEEVTRLERFIEAEREVPLLLAKWQADGRPEYIDEGQEEVYARTLLRIGLSEALCNAPKAPSTASDGTGD